MSNRKGCVFCSSADQERIKDGKIRCKAHSEWREPFDNICKDFKDNKAEAILAEIRSMKGPLK